MYTYLIISKELLSKYIEKELLKRGNWKVANKDDKYVDFLYLNSIAYRNIKNDYPSNKLLNINHEIKNMEITHKNNLIQNIRLKDPILYNKFFPKQYNIDLNDINPEFFEKKIKDFIWFLKPVFSWAGRGIILINNYKSFKDNIKMLKKRFITNNDEWNRNHYYVLSKEIKPLLFNKKKFHIRIAYICTNLNNKKRFYLFKKGLVITASDDYDGNSLSKLGHDTHIKSTNRIRIFPDDLITIYSKKKIEEVFRNIIYIFKQIKSLSTNKCHEKSENCYESYGVDILISEDFIPHIIEINSKAIISFNPEINELDSESKIQNNEKEDLFNKMYAQGILEITTDKLFPPKEKIKKKNFFIRL